MKAGDRPGGVVAADFRRAMAAPDREARVAAEVVRLDAAAARGDAAAVVLPADRDAAAAARIAGMPLVHIAVHVARESGAPVTLHTRSGNITDFLALAPAAGVRIVFHLNGEEAAMRWERHDAAPGRRIAAAARLAREGWAVSVRAGAVRLFRGWKDDYADLAQMSAAAGLAVETAYFPGEHVMEPATDSGDGLTPVVADDGLRFLPTARQRREVAVVFAAGGGKPAPRRFEVQPSGCLTCGREGHGEA